MARTVEDNGATSVHRARRSVVIDVACAMALALAVLAGTLWLTRTMPRTLRARALANYYFEADIPRVFENMSSRDGNHSATARHPLFSIASAPLVLALDKVAGLPRHEGVRVHIVATAVLWSLLMYGLLRAMGCSVLDAVLFFLVAASTSASLFWMGVAETFACGSVTVLFALWVSAIACRRKLPVWCFVAANLASMSMTITNWIAGLSVTFARYDIRRAIRLVLASLLVVILLWSAQKQVFKSAAFFLPPTSQAGGSELSLDAAAIGQRAVAFFMHGAVIPAVDERTAPDGIPFLSVQSSNLIGDSAQRLIAGGLWLVLLAMGAWSCLKLEGYGPFRAALAVTIVGQFALHLCFGKETFLYSMHFTPLLVLVAAMGTQRRFRHGVRVVACCFVGLALVNNVARFKQVEDRIRDHSERIFVSLPTDAVPEWLDTGAFSEFLAGCPDSSTHVESSVWRSRCEATLIEVKAMRTWALGKQHPSTRAVVYELARLCEDQGRFIDAERYYRDLLDECTEQAGATLEACDCKSHLAGLHLMTGRFAEAAEMYAELVTLQEREYGPDHDDTMASRRALLAAYAMMGRLADVRDQVEAHVQSLRARAQRPDASQALLGEAARVLQLVEPAELRDVQLGQALATRADA